MRITWKKQARETGLRAVGAAPRGYDLRIDGECVASVAPNGGHGQEPLRGWYWYAPTSAEYGITLRNSLAKKIPLYPTPEAAKEACRAYVEEQMKKARAATAAPGQPPPIQIGQTRESDTGDRIVVRGWRAGMIAFDRLTSSGVTQAAEGAVLRNWPKVVAR